MKKLMIALAAVAFAAVSQAATCDWSTGRILAPGSDGTGWSSSNISGAGYLATIYFWDNSTDAGDLTKAMTGITGTSSSTISSKALKGTTSDSFASATTYYTQVIVTYGDSTLTSEIASFEKAAGAMDDPKVNFFSGTGFKETFSGDYGAFSAAGWQTVPEPTSGLLLLLGVAGLALRRRRA